MSNSGIYIEGITRKEFFEAIAGVMEVVQMKIERKEYSVNELSEMTGYSPAHLRKLIRLHDIPYRKTGKQLFVPYASLNRIPTKKPLFLAGMVSNTFKP